VPMMEDSINITVDKLETVRLFLTPEYLRRLATKMEEKKKITRPGDSTAVDLIIGKGDMNRLMVEIHYLQE